MNHLKKGASTRRKLFEKLSRECCSIIFFDDRVAARGDSTIGIVFGEVAVARLRIEDEIVLTVLRGSVAAPAVVLEVRAGGGGKEAVVGTVKVHLVGRLADEPDPALLAAAALEAPRPHVIHAQGHAVAHWSRGAVVAHAVPVAGGALLGVRLITDSGAC